MTTAQVELSGGRRVPESNRTTRLCRPLPNRSVNAPRFRNKPLVYAYRTLLRSFTAGLGVRSFYKTTLWSLLDRASCPFRARVSSPVERQAHPVSPRSRSGGLTDHRPAGDGASTELACAALVAHTGSLHSLARGRVEREHRQRLLRRNAVPRLDVSQRARACGRPCGSRYAAGAAVSGLVGVAS